MEKMKIRALWGESLKIGHFQTIELMPAEAGRGIRTEYVAELGGVVTGFNVTAHCIDCMCGKEFVKNRQILPGDYLPKDSF